LFVLKVTQKSYLLFRVNLGLVRYCCSIECGWIYRVGQ